MQLPKFKPGLLPIRQDTPPPLCNSFGRYSLKISTLIVTLTTHATFVVTAGFFADRVDPVSPARHAINHVKTGSAREKHADIGLTSKCYLSVTLEVLAHSHCCSTRANKTKSMMLIECTGIPAELEQALQSGGTLHVQPAKLQHYSFTMDVSFKRQ